MNERQMKPGPEDGAARKELALKIAEVLNGQPINRCVSASVWAIMSHDIQNPELRHLTLELFIRALFHSYVDAIQCCDGKDDATAIVTTGLHVWKSAVKSILEITGQEAVTMDFAGRLPLQVALKFALQVVKLSPEKLQDLLVSWSNHALTNHQKYYGKEEGKGND